jgi:uncharacterized protein (TIGR03083 family)
MTPVLTPDRYLEALGGDSARLASVAERGLEPAVPCCAGWTVRDAVVHTGEVYWHKIMTMRLGRWPEDGEWPTEPAQSEDSVGWFRAAYAALVEELTSRGPEAPSVTWWPADQTVGFWYRRMAQEVAVHRVDVELAHDDVTWIPDDIAVDGVDEVLRLFLPAWGADAVPAGATGQAVAIESGGHRWVVVLDAAGARVDDSGPVAAQISGHPAAVDLWLWGRRGLGELTVEGDHDSVDALRTWLVDATQ